MSSSSTSSAPTRTARIEPSVPAAIGVFLAYVIAFIGATASSGIPFDEWFATAANAWRTAVLGLALGSLVLVVFVLWARWDHVFRDPVRLPMPAVLKVVVGLHVLGIVISFATRNWDASVDLLVPVILAGIGVGFAEETLFRGIILRALRTDYRPEYTVVIFSAASFGLFHLTNFFNGATTFYVVSQVLIATLAGAVLYCVRRYYGVLLLGMIIHGLWDIGVFLPVNEDLSALGGLTPYVGAVIPGIIALVVLRRDRDVSVTSAGVVPVGGEAS